MRILHIAGNYPDPSFDQPTTRAVQNLVSATQGECHHLVASIKRLNAFQESTHVDGNVISLGYRGLPALVGMSIFQKRVADRLAGEIEQAGFTFDIVHAHKLTVEGVVAHELARKTGKPYVTTIRGYTDSRMLKWRPDCHPLFRQVLLGSAAVFVPAPWARRIVGNLLGARYASRGKLPPVVTLPNIVQHTEVAAKPVQSGDEPIFVTVFRAGQGANKGFRGVIEGARSLLAEGRKFRIHVIGCNNDAEEAGWVEQAGLAGCVKFLGRMSHDRALGNIAGCSGLVLPSLNETFGMVYVEALLSGVPVLYSANTGIDGSLDGLSSGVRVDAANVKSVADGMRDLTVNLPRYRENLRLALQTGKLDFFRSESIVATYLDTMRPIAASASGSLGT